MTAVEQAMRRAISLAASTRPHPNPKVGAVIIDSEGRMLAQGAHRGPGHPHAERVALDALTSPPSQTTTLVITLEPCDHRGRTPPCTERIIRSGIRRVVVGTLDPDPRVSGRGIRRLREAGLEVEHGLLSAEVEEADPAYFHHRRHNRSRMTLKRAMTLDGQTAARDGTSRWITDVQARDDTHRLRAESDAVMVGAGTLRSDDPLLTVRLAGYRGPQPRAVVVAGDGPLPSRAQVWDRPDTITVAARMVDVPGEVVLVGKGDDGLPDMTQVAALLGERGMLEVLVEGGSRISSALWQADIVDRGIFYIGGSVAGGSGIPVFSGHWDTLGSRRPVEIIRTVCLGSDVRIDWRPVRQRDLDDYR